MVDGCLKREHFKRKVSSKSEISSTQKIDIKFWPECKGIRCKRSGPKSKLRNPTEKLVLEQLLWKLMP